MQHIQTQAHICMHKRMSSCKQPKDIGFAQGQPVRPEAKQPLSKPEAGKETVVRFLTMSYNNAHIPKF